MARLHVPHHPDRVFKDDWWDGYTTPSGYRALATDDDPLEAFAVVLDADVTPEGTSLAAQIIALSEPFVRNESFTFHGSVTVIGFYAPRHGD